VYKLIIILFIISIIAVLAFYSFEKPVVNVGNRSAKTTVSAEETVGDDNFVEPVGDDGNRLAETEKKQPTIKNEVCKKNDKCEDSEDSSEPVIYKKYF